MAAALNQAEPITLSRWRTQSPTHEARILRSGENHIFQLYNAAVQALEYTQTLSLEDSIGSLRTCYRRWSKRDSEVRVFKTSHPRIVHCIRTDPSEKRAYSFSVKDLTDENIQAILQCVNPVFLAQNNLLHIWFGTPADPIPPEDVWKPVHETSETGFILAAPDGGEYEIIRVDKGLGILGHEEVRAIRKKRNAEERLICEIFNRTTGATREIPLAENRPQASLFDRIYDVAIPEFASLTYGRTNLPEAITYTGPIGGPYLLAEGENLATLPLSVVERTVAAQLKYKDGKGREISAYNVRKFSVRKTMDESPLGKKPFIIIHIERNAFAKSTKPILSFLESLFCIGNWKLYQSSVSKSCMKDQIFRYSQQTEVLKKQAWETFKKAFVQCGIIDIKIACDRTWGDVLCDDKTLTMRTAKAGFDLRQAPGTLANWILRKRQETPLAQELPYFKTGDAEIQNEPI